MKNKQSFLLALLGGVILLSQGITGSIGFFAYLSLVEGIPELVNLVPLINMLIWVLTAIAMTGGLGAIVGGYLLTTNRTGTGKFVIGIAVGMSLIGLILNLIQLVWLYGFTSALDLFAVSAQSLGFVGVILTILARRTAKTD